MLNSFEEICVMGAAAENSFARVLLESGIIPSGQKKKKKKQFSYEHLDFPGKSSM